MEPRSLLVTRHDPSTFPKIGSIYWNCSKSLKKFGGRKNFNFIEILMVRFVDFPNSEMVGQNVLKTFSRVCLHTSILRYSIYPQRTMNISLSN